MKGRFPLYIPSKGRADCGVTTQYLTEMGLEHYVVVEPDQADEYRKNLAGTAAEVLPMDLSYKEKYDTCDDLGLSKSTGPGPARNFIWDHSVSVGADWHWTMDDNIKGFYRFNKNLKVPCKSPAFWAAMEDFSLRYENVAMVGPNYCSFAPRKTKQKPFICNTRIYSCNLIKNDAPFRWRGRYNEDTILSIDMLKDGWCTIQFNAFLQFKLETQALKGGNTEEFYHAEGKVRPGEKYADTGTVAKSKMLARVHPDIASVVYRYRRVHHHVDYRPFKKNKLVRKKGYEVSKKPDNYGMNLVQRPQGGSTSNVSCHSPIQEGSGETFPTIKVNAT